MSRRKSTDVDPDQPPSTDERADEHDGDHDDANAAAGAPLGEGETAPVESAEQLRSELEQAADRVLRLQAEMENLRNRTSREIGDVRRYASMTLLQDLLPVVDNIERAIEAAENTKDAESLVEGFKLVAQQLAAVLTRHNCTAIEALGQPFDPNLHEAISQQPSADHPAGTVILTTQTGYRLHDRVVRPSQVIVSTEPPTA